MDSSSPALVSRPSMEPNEKGIDLFDSSKLQKQPNLPTEFIWPRGELQGHTPDKLNEPLIDLGGFIDGDEEATAHAVELVRTACTTHGFFQVTNHGVDANLIRAAYRDIDAVFKLPLNKKLGFQRKPGGFSGYSAAHADRFPSKLPWKETFSFGYQHQGGASFDDDPDVVHYFRSALGEDFEHTG